MLCEKRPVNELTLPAHAVADTLVAQRGLRKYPQQNLAPEQVWTEADDAPGRRPV